jgi:hypothetical protein
MIRLRIFEHREIYDLEQFEDIQYTRKYRTPGNIRSKGSATRYCNILYGFAAESLWQWVLLAAPLKKPVAAVRSLKTRL